MDGGDERSGVLLGGGQRESEEGSNECLDVLSGSISHHQHWGNFRSSTMTDTRHASIDNTPITLDLFCQNCQKKRQLRCEIAEIKPNYVKVKTTCHTCGATITK